MRLGESAGRAAHKGTSTTRSDGTRRTMTMCMAWAVGAAALFVTACEETVIETVFPEIVTDPIGGTRLSVSSGVLGRIEPQWITIQIGNVGVGTLTMQEPTIEGSGKDAYRILRAPSSLLGGARAQLVVEYRPTAPVTEDATLHLVSNDPKQSHITWPIDGRAREPCVLQASPARMSFAVGEVKPVTLTAMTSADCRVTNISFDRRIFPVKNEPEVPFVLAGKASVTLDVEHRAMTTVHRRAPIREMYFYDEDGGSTSVVLEGAQPLFGCLTAEPLEYVFPQTELGASRTTHVTVTNRCGKSADVLSAAFSRGWQNYEILAPARFPVSVPANNSIQIEVRYTPTSPLGDAGELIISTNDGAASRFVIQLRGTAAVPEITYFPEVLDFGSVIYRDTANDQGPSDCSSAVRIVKVYNTGSAPLRIDSLDFDVLADPEFTVTGVVVGTTPVPNFRDPFNIPQGSFAEITLQFYPVRTTPSRHEGRLLIHHNAGLQPSSVRLIGQAATDGPVSDQFRQLDGPKVDILWVIDDSCSMHDEQGRLIANMSRFVGYADSRDADYQMAVTVTDGRSREAGTFRECWPHPRILNSDYPEREAAFRCLFEAGTNGSGIEDGLAAARQSLLRAQNTADPRNPNRGFLRNDASLAIVIVSDENDQSLESQTLLRDYFFSVKGPGRVKVHAIAGPTDRDCPRDPRIQPGYRYLWMTQATGGIFFNICEDDWQPVLDRLGLTVFTPLDQWQLSQSAVPSSVAVTVNGRPVPWSTTHGFTYDASTGILRFYGSSVPARGETIDVNYLGNCRP